MKGLTVRAARVNANLTQELAAYELEISRSTLSRIENNNSVARYGLLEKMALLYNIKVEDFRLGKAEGEK